MPVPKNARADRAKRPSTARPKTSRTPRPTTTPAVPAPELPCTCYHVEDWTVRGVDHPAVVKE